MLSAVVPDPGSVFRTQLLPLCVLLSQLSIFIPDSPRSIVNYSRLVMFSFGFQAVQRGLQREDIFFQRVSRHLFLFVCPCSMPVKCFDAACAVITTVVDRLAPTGYMRFAPDGVHLFKPYYSDNANFLCRALHLCVICICLPAKGQPLSIMSRFANGPVL